MKTLFIYAGVEDSGSLGLAESADEGEVVLEDFEGEVAVDDDAAGHAGGGFFGEVED